jgi:hypothetical protein
MALIVDNARCSFSSSITPRRFSYRNFLLSLSASAFGLISPNKDSIRAPHDLREDRVMILALHDPNRMPPLPGAGGVIDN